MLANYECDLHGHTNRSDGNDSPVEYIRHAVHRGVKILPSRRSRALPRPLRPTLPRTAVPGRPPASAVALRWACGWSWAIGC